MPVHRSFVISAGSTHRSVFLCARASDGSAITGLDATIEGLAAAFVRDGEASARPIRPVPAPDRGHVAGGFAAIDQGLMPGWYRLDLPDEALAPGASRVVVTVQLGGLVFDPIEIALVGFDPHDPFAMGLATLDDAGRQAFGEQTLAGMAGLEER
jgi:hypothetical protein